MNSNNVSIDSINDKNKSDNDNPIDFIENYDIEGYRIDKELLNDSKLVLNINMFSFKNINNVKNILEITVSYINLLYKI